MVVRSVSHICTRPLNHDVGSKTSPSISQGVTRRSFCLILVQQEPTSDRSPSCESSSSPRKTLFSAARRPIVTILLTYPHHSHDRWRSACLSLYFSMVLVFKFTFDCLISCPVPVLLRSVPSFLSYFSHFSQHTYFTSIMFFNSIYSLADALLRGGVPPKNPT